jgi:sulfate transport system ATP-binding protein
VPASKREIGFVFQNYALFRYMTVYENIAFGLRVQKADKKYIDERVHELINLIGLVGLEKRYPSQLSGGQRQRVAFARALAPNPHLLLLDEPFAAIDAKVRQELRQWLKEMIEKLGVTSIFVTHDQDEAIEVADEIIVTNKGRIEQTGTPIEVYENPKTSFTSGFFGQAAIIDNYESFKSFVKIDGASRAIIRPEFVKITKKNETLKFKSSATEGTVERVLFRGDRIEYAVRVNGVLLNTMRNLDEEKIDVGEKVDVFVYRMFVNVGEKAILLRNQAIRENVVVI